VDSNLDRYPPELIEELLAIAEAISRGEIPEYQHNECFTAGAFDSLLLNLRGPEAYQLLNQLCERFVAVRIKGESMAGYYWLLSEVVRQTNTTEIPAGMHAIVSANPELSRQLKAWYRLEN